MKQVEVIKAVTGRASRSLHTGQDKLRIAPYCRVSTDSEEQLDSYKSQVQYYTEHVNSKSDWTLVDIYADAAITGTSIKNRVDFQRLINDCMAGKIDIVITKSISRFARNTLDTLKYVRMLKEKGIAVIFEEENINTLTMDGELLLVILSSVAQQEVENISAHVKHRLKAKMQRGELVAFKGCLGYDYDIETKSIVINEEEAETVRYIFKRYLEGAGAYTIGGELEERGYKTKFGNTTWADNSIIKIIQNEKYKGDVLQGKTFVACPIQKRRLDNFGEQDKFYIADNHEAIISADDFEEAQKILAHRSGNRKGTRQKFSRKYAFSSKLECAFCSGNLSRRVWHPNSKYESIVWQCTTDRKNRNTCQESKGIAEKVIEDAFIESYRLICGDTKGAMEDLLKRIEKTMKKQDHSKDFTRIDKEITKLTQKKKKLLDMYVEDLVDRESYELKNDELSASIAELQEERSVIEESMSSEKSVKEHLAEFRYILEQNEALTTFSREVFESVVDKVIVGSKGDEGNIDPYQLTFVYKTGLTDRIDGGRHNPKSKKSKENPDNTPLSEGVNLYSNTSHQECCRSDDFTCR